MLFVDECHLVWGDACGYAWGPSTQRLELPIRNQRERQTYYGALNAVTGERIVIPVAAGNTDATLLFLTYLREEFPTQQLILCWDGASYHRSCDVRTYLEAVNHGVERANWPLTCVQFAPHAPEQNPIEDVWLLAKTYMRRRWNRCAATFTSIKDLFEEGLNTITVKYAKLRMYFPPASELT